jgi:hypothetical protein
LTIDVETEHDVGYLLRNMLTFLGVDLSPLTFNARARVTIDSPASLNQVAPIALKCPDPCGPPWPGWTGDLFTDQRVWPLDPTSGGEQTFRYFASNTKGSTWVPVELPGATFNDAFCADPSTPNSPNCNQTEIPTPSLQQVWLQGGSTLSPDQVRSWLGHLIETPGLFLVPVYTQDPVADGDYDIHVIGFAAFSFTLVPGPVPGPVEITGTFHKMFYDTAHTPGGGAYDFGVRTIALSGCPCG